MDSKIRSRANSELLMSSRLTNGHHSWITEAFQKYHLHASVSGDVAHLRHIESRYLGTATLQLGAQCFPHASFYEITESEISDQGLDRKHVRSPSTQDVTPPFQDQLDDHDHHLVDGAKLSAECCSASEVSCGRPDCAYLSLSESIAAATLLEKYAADDDNLHNKSSVALPPKKRKRRRIIRQDIVFTFVPHEDEDDLPPDADYYCFPKDALAEPLTNDSPFELVVSFQLCKTMLSEDFLDSVCPSTPQLLFNDRQSAFLSDSGYQNLSFSRTSHRRFTDPGQKPVAELAFQTMQVVNLRISNASTSIYNAIKKSVSRFESLCRRMVELSKQHNERVAIRKAEELSVSRSISSTSKSLAADDEDDEMEDKHHGYESTDTICKVDNWSSDENGWDKDSQIDGLARANSVSATSDIHMDTSMSGNKSSGSDAMVSPKLSASLPCKLPSQPGLHHANNSKQNKQQSLTNGSLKKCLYCGSKSTPMWRRGPQGAGTLCNACGVKWKHGKILCGVATVESSSGNDGGHVVKERKGSKADKKRKKAEATAAKKEKRPKVKNRKGKKPKTAMDGVEEDPNAFTHGMELDEDEDSNVESLPIGDSTPKGDAYLYDDEDDDDDSSTLAGQDHMDIQTAVKAEPVFAIPFARNSSSSDTRQTSSQMHAQQGQQMLLQPGRATWDTIYSSSSSSSISTSELFSPRESYASSPTSSPSSLLLDVHQSDKKNNSNQGLVNALSLAQTAADDAVEAATVLTMLRSS